jgi:tetratricopeptide (TPR) repeat protein
MLPLAAQSDFKANALFEEGRYEEAKTAYAALLKRSPRSVLYAYRYARCAQETGDHRTAVEYFRNTGKKYVLTYFFLGESYMELWRPEEAIEAYRTYLAEASDNARARHAAAQIRVAEMRQRYLRRVRDIAILDSVMMPKAEFLAAYRLSPEAGTLTQDTDGCVSYRNQRSDRYIYTVRTGTGSSLVSSYRLLDRWSVPDTLDATVNFTPVQNYPFCQSDGVTITFAAEDPDGFGGLDIYICRYNSATDTYTKPENAGFPFNSEGNDYMLATDEAGRSGWFATDRSAPPDSVCVYRFLLTDEPQYLSGLTPDSLALYARLEAVHRASQPLSTNAVAVAPEEETEDEDGKATASQNGTEGDGRIVFVLNDHTVYSTEDTFVSPEALQLYRLYRRQEQELRTEGNRLEGLREQYRSADTEHRKQLALSILSLEKKVRALQADSAATLQQVRVLETAAANTAAPQSN